MPIAFLGYAMAIAAILASYGYTFQQGKKSGVTWQLAVEARAVKAAKKLDVAENASIAINNDLRVKALEADRREMLTQNARLQTRILELESQDAKVEIRHAGSACPKTYSCTVPDDVRRMLDATAARANR